MNDTRRQVRQGQVHVVYRGHDNHVYEVSWGGADPLTGHDVTPNGPAMAGDPSGYFAASENMRHIFYRSAEAPAHLYELWSGGAVPSGRGDITPVFRLRAGGVVPFTVRAPRPPLAGGLDGAGTALTSMRRGV